MRDRTMRVIAAEKRSRADRKVADDARRANHDSAHHARLASHSIASQFTASQFTGRGDQFMIDRLMIEARHARAPVGGLSTKHSVPNAGRQW